MENKPYLIALNKLPNIGPRTILNILSNIPNLNILPEISAHELKNMGFSKKIIEILKTIDLKTTEEDITWEQQQDNHHILTIEDVRYPQILKEIYDPPIILYTYGNLQSLKQIMVAMIGTRNPSIHGKETAQYFAKNLASNKITIVSGLAIGIDAFSHKGCLNAKGQTIAVLGTGIDCIYPKTNQKLALEISQNGLILSEFPLKTPPIAGHFPRRNRIISGLSKVILVIEAAIRSGSLITARLALEQNRDVLAIPGSIYNSKARGCLHLLRQGAKLIISPADVLEELGIVTEEVDNPYQLATSSLSNNKKLMELIDYELTPIDKIIQYSGLNAEIVSSELVALELQGLIQAIPGGYVRCLNEK